MIKIKKQVPIKFSPKSISIKGLKIHPLIEILGHDAIDDIFIGHVKHFKHLETPVISDGYVLSNVQSFLAAQKLKHRKIDVIEMEVSNPDEVVRFVNFKNLWKHGENREMLREAVKYLTEFLTKKEVGKRWAKEIDAPKTRGKIAKILGVSDGSIGNLTRDGQKPNNKRQTGKTSVQNNNLKTVEFKPPFILKDKEFDDLEISNETLRGESSIEEIQIKMRGKGTLKIASLKGKTELHYNGQKLQMADSFFQSNETDKTVDYEHVAFVESNGSFAIHLSVRSINSLISKLKIAA